MMIDSNGTQQNLKKKFEERVLTLLFPVRLISKQTWLVAWKQREDDAYLVSARVYFGAFFVIYIAHFFFVDIPAKKEPILLWAGYRGECAILHLMGLLLTFSNRFMESCFRRAPIYIITATCVYMQGRSMEWLSTVPPFYVPLLGAIGVLALRVSVTASVVALTIILAPSYKFFFVRPYETHHMVSATLVSLAVLAIFRSRKKLDVQLFVAEQTHIEMQAQLIKSKETEVELSKKQYHLAAQVAHDIRSPLATLNAVVHNSEGVDELVRSQIKVVISRIRDTANNLLKIDPFTDNSNLDKKSSFDQLGIGKEVSGTQDEAKVSEPISIHLSSIVTEKRMQFSNEGEIEICLNEASTEPLCFVEVPPAAFARVLSNLIDNAVQALNKIGKVTIKQRMEDHKVQVIIEDNGVGMLPDVLSKLGTRGYSYGKRGSESGSGLGVYHAIESVNSWGGQLKYESEIGKGTKAVIVLPRAKTPTWFVESLSVTSFATIVILADDPSMQNLWKERLHATGLGQVKVLCFSYPRDLIQWYRETLGEISHPIYLCDDELNKCELTSLDVIEMLGIGHDAILIANRWNDIELRNKCKKLGVGILPKTMKCSITAN